MHRTHPMIVPLLAIFGILGCSSKRPAAQAPGSPPAPSPTVAVPAAQAPEPPPAPSPTMAERKLPNPLPISPANGVAMRGYPRTVTFQWSDVPGATRYGIEIDCYGCCTAHRWCTDVGKSGFTVDSLTQPTYTFDFWGDQPGRWRVWAVAPGLGVSEKSQWSEFTFGKVMEGNIIPPVIPPAAPSELVACNPASRPAFGAGVTPPKAIYAPNAEYSDAARRDKLNGTVELGVDIGDDGQVRAVCIARSLRADLDAQAVAAVKTWRFEPARREGAAIPWYDRVHVVFRLR